MKYLRNIYLLSFIILTLSSISYSQPPGRKVENFNFGWMFYKGDIPDGQNPLLNDSGWRTLDQCDEKGFLVIDEAFDEWELPKKKWIERHDCGIGYIKLRDGRDRPLHLL